jgi:hypothetical protein
VSAQAIAQGAGAAARIGLPQHGGCLCGDVRYGLGEDALTLYACHCTDCQTQTGSSFALSMIVRSEALKILHGVPQDCSIGLADGRRKRAKLCGRCSTRLWGPTRVPGIDVLEPGTLDDTSWLRPVGHIWTRSAQPWFRIPEGTLEFREQPSQDGIMDLIRAWKQQQAPQ